MAAEAFESSKLASVSCLVKEIAKAEAIAKWSPLPGIETDIASPATSSVATPSTSSLMVAITGITRLPLGGPKIGAASAPLGQ